MHNIPTERTQIDGKQDEYSAATAIDCSDSDENPDATRQEFREDVDINTILRRFGVSGAQQRQLQYGEVDYDVGLQEAIYVTEAAQDAWRRMSPELRNRYPTWQLLMQAIAAGEVKIRDEPNNNTNNVTETGDPPPAPPSADA